jgi:hypothetical protein
MAELRETWKATKKVW